jgi:serine/threonine protein kinase
MSPEQCKGKPIDRRSDIFALGICLYELTTLRRAFKGNDDFETMKRIVAGDVILPSVAVNGYPRELEAIILTALASDPNARFQTAQEMIEAIDAFAVRAKLTGSNTALGRFMTQLFGSKREPWVVDGNSGDPTQISETDPEGMDDDIVDGEKTAIMADGMVQRLAAQAVGDMPAVSPVYEPHDIPAATPAQGLPAARPTPQPQPQSQPHHIPLRLGTEPSTQSEPGAQPLLDESLGWSTGIKPLVQPEASATRLGTPPPIDLRIRNRRGWLILILLMAIGLAAGVGIAMTADSDSSSAQP